MDDTVEPGGKDGAGAWDSGLTGTHVGCEQGACGACSIEPRMGLADLGRIAYYRGYELPDDMTPELVATRKPVLSQSAKSGWLRIAGAPSTPSRWMSKFAAALCRVSAVCRVL